jgi:hypothetical protein
MHGVLFVLLLHCKNIMAVIAYPPSDSDPEHVGVGGQKVIHIQGHEIICNAC